MRWKHKPWKPQQLDEARRWFAWHPVVIGKRWVWLEYVSRTLTGWYSDMDGSRPAYEYADINNDKIKTGISAVTPMPAQKTTHTHGRI